MPFHSIRLKIMLPFLLWLLALLLLIALATFSVFRYLEERRVQALTRIPQAFFAIGFENYLEQIKRVTDAEVVVFNKTNGVIDTTLPEIPSDEIADCVRVAEARPLLFQQNKPYVSWNVRCRDVPYRAVHYPLDRLGRIWTYLLNRTESVQAQRRLIRWLAVISIVGILLGALLGHLISRTVTRPVAQLVEATHRVAQGDLSQRSGIRSRDEIGRLAEAFNQMTEQLQASQRALLEAERFSTAGRMAASLAHEIRNPLSSIRMLIQVLERRVPPENKRYVQAVAEELERLNVVVDGLLDFARSAEPQFQETDIAQVVDGVLQLMEANLRHHHIQVQRDYQPLPAVQADPAKLKQACMNLILNAMQAMPEGGTLTVRLFPEGEGVGVQIEDTGVGMTEEQQQHLFEPFFTTKERGTGLGLTNTLRIVEQHRGTIRVASTLGVGTTVSVWLPRIQEARESSPG